MNDGVNIAEYLSVGEENAIKTKDLANRLNMTSRQLTIEINRARCSGEIILSGVGGYFLPGNDDEIQHFCRMMHSRRRKIADAVRSAEKYLAENRT